MERSNLLSIDKGGEDDRNGPFLADKQQVGALARLDGAQPVVHHDGPGRVVGRHINRLRKGEQAALLELEYCVQDGGGEVVGYQDIRTTGLYCLQG